MLFRSPFSLGLALTSKRVFVRSHFCIHPLSACVDLTMADQSLHKSAPPYGVRWSRRGIWRPLTQRTVVQQRNNRYNALMHSMTQHDLCIEVLLARVA